MTDDVVYRRYNSYRVRIGMTWRQAMEACMTVRVHRMSRPQILRLFPHFPLDMVTNQLVFLLLLADSTPAMRISCHMCMSPIAIEAHISFPHSVSVIRYL